jgi:4-hydroxy-tetrahydrodipicolinate reductase
LKDAARVIPIIAAPNFSVGVNALFWLAAKTHQLLGDGFDVEIVEAHHRQKKDAPSGTAKRLAETLASAPAQIAYGREGMVGARKRGEIGIHSIRGGDIVGDHTVVFAGMGERLELTHRASSRETFAAGALRAAIWIVGRAPGIYSMEDVLGLSTE